MLGFTVHNSNRSWLSEVRLTAVSPNTTNKKGATNEGISTNARCNTRMAG